ncbi:hypothetical protein [Criblamydia sequanensis]|uniref:Uncharacterized protein n=1 Tax=Candidatus Criblamydia sequanensis CRIB-18 TaxID=1437425 RepID=A0A090D0A1_9BACT|nr:hypothetical protein [Criblamydia sequanensis]CDR34711.1 hypothetical protein CSEC_1904 [Criblamydia sequanensis CRIB-18]
MSRYFWKISQLLIIFSLFACHRNDVKRKEELFILDRIVAEHSQAMFAKYGLSKWSYYTFNGDCGITAVNVGMEILGPKDINYAKKLILEASKDLLSRLLKEPILQQVFVDKKINLNAVSYNILFKSKKRDQWVCHDLKDWKNQLNMVRLRNGELLYTAKGVEFDSGNSFTEKIDTLDYLEE